jgi:glycosyltransferase involved in cell wall biosynthesis
VAIAEAIRGEIMHLFKVQADRTIMIPNAVDARRLIPATGREATRRAMGIPVDAPVILSVAALTWEKDPLAHIEVTRQVLGKHHEAIHLIAGDGPMREELKQRVRELDLVKRVRLLGSRSDMADIFCASDILLFASRSDGMEGMPTILIEAGMAGLPVVGYAIAGVSEVVVDGLTGLLIGSGRAEDLAINILVLLNDEERRHRMGQVARQRCLEMFDIRAIAPQYKALYEQLISAS